MGEHFSYNNVDARARTAELCVELALSLLHVPNIPPELIQTDEAFAALRHACALEPNDDFIQYSYELARDEFSEQNGSLEWEHEPAWIELSALVGESGYESVLPEFEIELSSSR